MNQLLSMEEDRFLAGFHQQVQKARDKSWHDLHIKRKACKEGDLVFLYDSKSLQHPGKLRMHWLGPYEVKSVTDGGVVQFKDLAGAYLRGMINGSWMKLYKDSRPPTTQFKEKKKKPHEASKGNDNSPYRKNKQAGKGKSAKAG
jgi:hypothetical protein